MPAGALPRQRCPRDPALQWRRSCCNTNFLSWNPQIWLKCHGSHLRGGEGDGEAKPELERRREHFYKHVMIHVSCDVPPSGSISGQLSRPDVPKNLCFAHELHDRTGDRFALFADRVMVRFSEDGCRVRKARLCKWDQMKWSKLKV